QRHHQPQVRLQQVVLRTTTVLRDPLQLAAQLALDLLVGVGQLLLGEQTGLDPLRELDLLLGVQQRDLADLLEVVLDRVGRRTGGDDLLRRRVVVVGVGVHAAGGVLLLGGGGLRVGLGVLVVGLGVVGDDGVLGDVVDLEVDVVLHGLLVVVAGLGGLAGLGRAGLRAGGRGLPGARRRAGALGGGLRGGGLRGGRGAAGRLRGRGRGGRTGTGGLLLAGRLGHSGGVVRHGGGTTSSSRRARRSRPRNRCRFTERRARAGRRRGDLRVAASDIIK